MMRSYEIYLTIDEEYQLRYKTGEAFDDYPASWSVIGVYRDIKVARDAANAHNARLKKAEYINTLPPIKFDLL